MTSRPKVLYRPIRLEQKVFKLGDGKLFTEVEQNTGQTDGRTDGWMDGWTDRQDGTVLMLYFVYYYFDIITIEFQIPVTPEDNEILVIS